MFDFRLSISIYSNVFLFTFRPKVLRDDARIAFPSARRAAPNGLLAIGGDLSVERLLAAYRRGIFPWYPADGPILWWSPDPRCVLWPQHYQPSRSVRRAIRRNTFAFTINAAFAEVIDACASTQRDDTWIDDAMKRAYVRLHLRGDAHSAEVWRNGRLVGGLYGVSMGRAFFGESMFSRETDASKTALAMLMPHLLRWDVRLIDCQMCTPHLLSLGAAPMRRAAFLRRLKKAVRLPSMPTAWRAINAQ